MHDIGLIKLKQPIRSGDRGQGFAIENSICLPPEDYREDIGSYALTAGYGYMGPNRTRKLYPFQMSYRIRAGYMEVKPVSDFLSIDNGGRTCKVSVYRKYLLNSGRHKYKIDLTWPIQSHLYNCK